MKKVIGLDLGRHSLGVAISDSLGITAHGFENFKFKKFEEAVARTLEICEEQNTNVIALGMPLSLKGEDTPGCNRSEKFKQMLIDKNKNLKIFFVDERYTTVIASQRMHELNINAKKQKNFIDMQSAVVILESFMNSKEFKNGKL